MANSSATAASMGSDIYGIIVELIYMRRWFDWRSDSRIFVILAFLSSSDLTGTGMATFNACQILQERLAPLRVKYAGCTWDELIKHAWLDRIDLSARGFTKVQHAWGARSNCASKDEY